MQARIDIDHDDEAWKQLLPDHKNFISQTIALCIKKFAKHPLFNNKKIVEVSVLLSHDEYMAQINEQYREQDKPTNVLSFATAHDYKSPLLDAHQTDPELMLGDLVFAHETIQREAAEQSKSFADHMRHLIIHGTLHLLGFDHMEDDEAERMEAFEIELLKIFNVANPYQ
ncbi:MAG: rRNA maturation RNase YbeY [Rickettsiales bacterium]|nr:rRNA maturation RNase YbeY [Rickettsiales bacterium]